MSTLMASYTTAISRLPIPPASSRGSWRSSVALKPSYAIRCRRPLTVTCALPEKERPTAFSIPPTVLLCPVPAPDGKERWDIKEDEDHVTLWLQVPGVSAKDIEVTTSTSGDVLVIKRKPAAGSGSGQQAADMHGVGAFHIRLLLTSEYDHSKVAADLRDGMLEVNVPKVPQRNGNIIKLGAPPGGKDASTEVSDDKTKQEKNKESKAARPPGLAN